MISRRVSVVDSRARKLISSFGKKISFVTKGNLIAQLSAMPDEDLQEVRSYLLPDEALSNDFRNKVEEILENWASNELSGYIESEVDAMNFATEGAISEAIDEHNNDKHEDEEDYANSLIKDALISFLGSGEFNKLIRDAAREAAELAVAKTAKTAPAKQETVLVPSKSIQEKLSVIWGVIKA